MEKQKTIVIQNRKVYPLNSGGHGGHQSFNVDSKGFYCDITTIFDMPRFSLPLVLCVIFLRKDTNCLRRMAEFGRWCWMPGRPTILSYFRTRDSAHGLATGVKREY